MQDGRPAGILDQTLGTGPVAVWILPDLDELELEGRAAAVETRTFMAVSYSDGRGLSRSAGDSFYANL
jgi:hypothetical protein